MLETGKFSRRRFIEGAAALMVAHPLLAQASERKTADLNGRVYKTLKIDMVRVPGSLAEEFKAVKAVVNGDLSTLADE